MTTDATQVTGSPIVGEGGARPGDVLAERYELLEVLDGKGPSFGYRAIDQETERPVLVRLLAGPPLDEHTLAEVLEILRGLVGVGGRFLSSLLDADREGRRPFTVEAWPSGTQLSSIFAARRVRGEALGAREVLPVAARLGAALAALPEPWHHGDVRAERVWVDTEGLRLTGAFLLAALPSHVLADRVALAPSAYAPELASGHSGPSSDRWGVAAIVWEALTSMAPDIASTPRSLGSATLAALRRALDPEPARRPSDVAPLLQAIAEQAGLQVPRIDPEPHLPPTAHIGAPPRPSHARVAKPNARRIEGAARESTQEISFDQILEQRPAARRIEGAAHEGTQEISFDQILEQRPVARRIEGAAHEGTQEISFDQILDDASPNANDTARHPALTAPRDDDSLDPRLVRAALGLTLDSDSEPRASSSSMDDSLDPRLVRAALGIAEDDSSNVELEELPSDELEVVADAPRAHRERRSPPGAKLSTSSAAEGNGDGATRRAASGAAPVHATRSRTPSSPPRDGRASASAAAKEAPRAPAVNAVPERSTPEPRSAGPAKQGTSSAAPRGAAPAAKSAPEHAPTGTSRPHADRAARGADGGTAVIPRPEEPAATQRPRRAHAGPLIVVGALVLAIAIIGIGFLVRSLITHERDSAVRERAIQERLEQIRSGGQAP